jgi:type IV pilus assembly protein PilY1
VIYYNPDVDYDPWSETLGDADPDNPRSHPYYAANYFDLSALFFTIDGINIPNAHYYVWSDTDELPYLVLVDGNSITYYKVNHTGERVESGDLILTASPPSDVTTSRNYTEERQNFANWYSYYRKRRSTAVAAIGSVIPKLQGVMVGIRSINAHILQKVLPVSVDGVDRSDEILDKLFSYHQGTHVTGSTPIRKGLQKIGKYYHVNETITPAEDELSESPLSSEDSGECQQNFAIMFTDGAYNGTSPGLGNIDDDMDAPYGDNASNTLADVAMYYWKEDLAPAVDDNVPTNSYDNATWQHMVTYTVAFGVEGNLDPDDYDLDNIVVENRVYPTWPSPINSDKKRIDDLWHTAVNGRGLYLNAKTPQELTQAFEDVVSNVLARIGSGASVSINGEELQEGLILYQSKYSTNQWTGDVVAYDIDETDGSIDSENPKWSASEVLDEDLRTDADYWDTGRIIATYDNSLALPAGIPFRFDSLSTDQQAVLTSSDMVDYLRGNHALEEQNGGGYRDRYIEDDNGDKERDTVLGDIVHSAPLYFNDMLFVGANDGMLHVFDSETGDELFAYIPDLVFDNLDDLTDPNYDHQYYVDLTPFAKDTGTQDLLVGGLGKGGKGYYCLDITNAKTVITSESALADKVMWEYPNSTTPSDEIADMGYSYSSAFIVNTYSTSHGWVVIFGNGYNSTNHDAVLFIVDADTGDLIKKINTDADATCNGLATPLPIDVNADGKVDYVYAGDLIGNLWKFDLTSDNPNDWDVAYKDGTTPKPLFQAKDDYGNPQPITTKPDAMFHCETRRHGYMIAFGTGRYLGDSDISDTNQQTLYSVWDYGDDSDDNEYLGSFERNSETGVLSNQPVSVSLLEQTVEYSGTVDGTDYRILTDNEITWKTEADEDTPPDDDTVLYDNPHSTESNHAGWYFDLSEEKERIIRDPLIRGGKIIGITSIPQSSSPCIAGGESWLMELNACTGGRTGGSQLDVDDDGDVDEEDLIQVTRGDDSESLPASGIKYSAMMYKPMIIDNKEDDTELKYFSTSAGNVIIMTEKDGGVGMYYWRQEEE